MRNIYLIDDDFTTRFVMEQKLKSDTFNFTAFEGGKSFIDTVQQDDLTNAVLLLDVNMPEMNGLETLSKLKLLFTLTDLTIVVLTLEENLQNQFSDIHPVLFEAKEHISTPFISSLL